MIKRLLILASLVAVPMMGGATQAQAEEYCREYNKTVSINGRAERAYGTACRQHDGSWEIVNLEGGNNARDKVRDTMYHDIEKYETRHTGKDYRSGNDRIIVIESHNYDRPKYSGRYKQYDRYNHRSNHRYHNASYNHWPFVIHWNIGGSKYYKNRGYSSKRYTKNTRYNNKRYSHRRY